MQFCCGVKWWELLSLDGKNSIRTAFSMMLFWCLVPFEEPPDVSSMEHFAAWDPLRQGGAMNVDILPLHNASIDSCHVPNG